MSRIGSAPVAIPSGVDVKVDGKDVQVKGPKGSLSLTLRREIDVEVEDGHIKLTNNRPARDRQARAFHGLFRALVQNMVVGVTEGYSRKLEINGVGYQAKQQGQKLVFNLGFANDIVLDIPSTVEVKLENPTNLLISGCDKQQVGEFAARIRKLRPPEPYKGKGIKYSDEIIRRKAGKAFGSA